MDHGFSASEYLVENDSGLDCRLVLHSLQTFCPLFELVGLVDNSLDLDLAGIEVINGSGCRKLGRAA